MTQKTIENTEPDFTGFARAWRVTYTVPKGCEDKDGTVGIWMINAPWAHPVWSNYMMLCVHLRPMPGKQRPAVIHKPGATHEVMLYALDPGKPVPVETFEGAELHPKLLTPANFVGQFTIDADKPEVADQLARELLESAAIKPICAGKLNPDTDASWQWIELFGDWCFKKAYRDAKPGSIEHHLKGGGTAVIIDGKALLLNPPPEAPPQH
jgi:hypothetical protein